MRVEDVGYGFKYRAYLILWGKTVEDRYNTGSYMIVGKIGVRI